MEPITTKSKPISFPPSREQLMLVFAFIADIKSGNPSAASRGVKEKIEGLFDIDQNPIIAPILAGWELVYGPAVYALNVQSARNTTVIFYNKKLKEMVIGVAGTNFISSYDWYTEDVNVVNMVAWNSTIMEKGPDNGGSKTEGTVSAGTATALMNTWNKKGTHLYTPIEWMKRHVKKEFLEKYYETTKISVTGHSLGGAISPVLAMALKENPDSWNGHDVTEFESYIFAGPTPGDDVFMKNVEGKIKIHSYRNTLDVVPHAWQIDQLEEIHTLYNDILPQAQDNNDGKLVYWVIESLVAQSKSAPNAYKRWSNDQFFEGKLKPITSKDKVAANTNGINLINHMNSDTISDLKLITGALPKSELSEKNTDTPVCKYPELQPYINYFLEFMGTLGSQHTKAYDIQIFNNATFEEDLKKIFYVPSGKIETKAVEYDALQVVQKLIQNVAVYYKKFNKIK